MKLIKTNKPQVSETKEVPGLVACRIEYEVKTAQGTAGLYRARSSRRRCGIR